MEAPNHAPKESTSWLWIVLMAVVARAIFTFGFFVLWGASVP
jgi:hypothetical protein